MEQKIISFDDMQEYVYSELVAHGYAPSQDEMYDIIDFVKEFLIESVGLEMVDD